MWDALNCFGSCSSTVPQLMRAVAPADPPEADLTFSAPGWPAMAESCDSSFLRRRRSASLKADLAPHANQQLAHLLPHPAECGGYLSAGSTRHFSVLSEMGFRFPDRIGDKYHFVPSVAKRSKTHSCTGTQATQHLQQHEDSRSGSSFGVQLYMRPFTAKSAGVPERGQRPGLNQEQHGLQADKGAQDSDLSRRQIAISSEAFRSRSGGIDGC
jgi:hypothetical protein